MEKDELTDELLEECPEVAKAKTEVDRLEYRANILKQVYFSHNFRLCWNSSF